MELMDMLGIETDREQVEKMINEIDEDGNGEIDFDEFLLVRQMSQGGWMGGVNGGWAWLCAT
jgi:Ca2+-binding EF-hand superfamily protein